MAELFEIAISGGANASVTVEHGLDIKDRLVARLRQLPGGQFLPTKGKFTHLENRITASPGVASPEAAAPSPDGANQIISTALPDTKAAHLIIGSGGLKAALNKANQQVLQPKDTSQKKKSTLQRHLDSEKLSEAEKKRNQARESFRKVYTELYPYYIDFLEHANDSLVFRDYKDLSEIGAVLARLVLFDDAMFLACDTKSISSNLLSTIQWFESR